MAFLTQLKRKFHPPSPYLKFTRKQWAKLREDTPLRLTQAELNPLHGLNENISLTEVAEVYLPLARLLHMYVLASRRLRSTASLFLRHPEEKIPFIIGMAGSVAVGKSTTARILQTLLSRWDAHPKVVLVPTDGFLYPNQVLQELEVRKGFPQSYDQAALLRFVSDVKAGKRHVRSPVYSHQRYDIVPNTYEVIDVPDIVIVEGLNVLQAPAENARKTPRLLVSDFFDFSLYVDAPVDTICEWYMQRFLLLGKTAFQNPKSYFYHYARLSDLEIRQRAKSIWQEINAPNLYENILPTRERADLILVKGEQHSTKQIYLRKL